VPEWSKVNDTLNNSLTTLYTDPALDVNTMMSTTNDDVQIILDEYWAGQ
jgi:hypothetical protein